MSITLKEHLKPCMFVNLYTLMAFSRYFLAIILDNLVPISPETGMESFERTPLNMRGVLDEVHRNKWLGKRLISRKTDTQISHRMQVK